MWHFSDNVVVVVVVAVKFMEKILREDKNTYVWQPCGVGSGICWCISLDRGVFNCVITRVPGWGRGWSNDLWMIKRINATTQITRNKKECDEVREKLALENYNQKINFWVFSTNRKQIQNIEYFFLLIEPFHWISGSSTIGKCADTFRNGAKHFQIVKFL